MRTEPETGTTVPDNTPAKLAPDKTPNYDLGDMDLETAAAAGAEMELRHPISGAPMGIYFHLVGADSQEYRDAYRKILDSVSRDQRKDVDAAVFEMRAAQAAAAACKGWRKGDDKGFIPYNKQNLPFTYENAVTVFYARRWIREQVELFMGQRANFFKG